ncbi:phenylalanine--tRNA ligase subunit beta [Buchnera aphidicola]|uniref:Phenylalanine--tRNA ligase beta subunit n=1 Tax=Buchnera aphidicola subsp. Cinara cedri (strain Cc) TaxID=372461 RepID=Q057Y9_BUCCC|nr:phenylalanine--tRNA ligase subunit beta [Buchnera aphidicola]ABJ90560.1 phenylalanyl-tRNA synthetase, b subunit [Buchnera aphidicola BCc]
MKFGEEWLREWINPSISVPDLCEQLTNFGCEVEYFKKKYKTISSVVIGQIISKEKYFLNKKFLIYNILINKNKKIYVVYFKKKYLSIGNKIPIILGKNCIKKNIKNLSLNNINNNFCHHFGSYHLLDIQKNNHKIIVLSKYVTVGLNFNDFFYKNDYLMKFFVPFNRIDLRSLWGLSREIAILNKLKIPKLIRIDNIQNKKKKQINCNINIENIPIQYFFCELYKINLDSILPFKMQIRLLQSNLLTDNIIENIINYIFIETGYWFHVFDLDHISKNLYIKSIKKKTYIFDTNKKKFFLRKGTIILTDLKNILSFEDMEYSCYSRISSTTKNLFLGSICFCPNFIQKRNLLIPFFSRKIEYSKYNFYPKIQKNIFKYIQKLILNICGGRSSNIKKYNLIKNFIITNKIFFTIRKLNKISGIIFLKKDIITILKSCYFSYIENNDSFYVTPPYWRLDIQIEEDVISEIIRMYGYEKIKSCPPQEHINSNISNKKSEEMSLSRIKFFLIDQGYNEIISYSFVNLKMQRSFISKNHFIKIQNPISNDMSIMRTSLWIGLLQCISYHQNRQYESIRVFEFGLCFYLKNKNKFSIIQDEYLSAAISGFSNRREWYYRKRKFDFYDLKGDVESILNILGKFDNIEFVSEKFLGLCLGKSAGIYLHGELIGFLDSSLHRLFNLKNSVILFEIKWKKICSHQIKKIKSISTLPISKRDISIIISDKIIVKDIIDLCNKNIYIKNSEIYVYDIYTGSNVPSGKKSISICFLFNSLQSMLKESDININILQCISALKDKFGAILRE